MFLVSILLIGALFVYFGNKKIAANLYEKTYKSVHKKSVQNGNKSPYKINRIYNTSYRKYYYTIVKSKNNKRVDDSSYWDIDNALSSLNELEKLENYELTTIED